MKGIHQFALGFLMALLFGAIILGSYLLSKLEGGSLLAILPTKPATATATGEFMPTMVSSPTGQLTISPSFTIFISYTPTLTFTPPTSCPVPADWVPIIVGAEDTLASIAQVYGISPEQLQAANCLITTTLLPGTVLYVPRPTPTPFRTTRVPTQWIPTSITNCGPPLGWVLYFVRPGDTLFSLSLAFGVTVAQLQWANCLGTSTLIRVGQALYVPNVPTRTPTRTLTQLATWTLTPTRTSTPTFTPTLPSAPSVTPTQTMTLTPIPTPTPTNTLTPTIPSSPTPTNTPPPPPTYTSTPGDTPTPPTPTFPYPKPF